MGQSPEWRDRGDESLVGEAGGSALSGGQKLRVGVARSLYSSQPVVLLDDPFSALDGKTAKRLLRFLLLLVERDKRLIILSTHSLFLFQAEIAENSEERYNSLQVVLLQRGHVMAMGPLAALRCSNSGYFNSLMSAGSCIGEGEG